MARTKKAEIRNPGDGLTEKRLLAGWRTADADVRVRLATAADIPTIERLVPAAGVDLGDEMAKAITEGLMGSAHRAALAAQGGEHGQRAFTRALAAVLAERGPDDAYLAAALVLVAEHQTAGVVGTLVAYPPPHVAKQFVEHAQRTRPDEDIRRYIGAGLMGVAKISALAVEEHAQRTGVGAALVGRVKKIYFYNGYFYVYGQMPARPGLPEFYGSQGFEIREPGEGLDLWVVFGIRGMIHPEPHERLFIRQRPR